MAAVKNRYVSDHDVACQLQSYRLVSGAVRSGIVPNESLSPDHAGTEDRNVLDTLTPYEAVVPMTMAEVLILTPFVRFRCIVPAPIPCRTRGDDRRALVQVQRHMALQMDREA